MNPSKRLSVAIVALPMLIHQSQDSTHRALSDDRYPPRATDGYIPGIYSVDSRMDECSYDERRVRVLLPTYSAN